MPDSVLVVTPSLNQGEFIRQTIESVLAQDFPSLEYWVMDGGSTDGTHRILHEYEGHPGFHWISEPDRGQAHAIAKGFARSDAAILAWLNADDLYAPGAVRKAQEALAADLEAVMVSGRVDLIDIQGLPIGRLAQNDLSVKEMLRLREFLPQPGVFFRREAFLAAGGLDQELEFAFDLDLFLRMRQVGKVCYINSVFAFHRKHWGSKTVSQHPSMRAEAAHVARRFVMSGCYRGKDRRELLSRIDLVEAFSAYQRRAWLLFGLFLIRGLARYPVNFSLLLERIKIPGSDRTQV